MKNKKSNAPRFAVCVDNSEYPAALELHKIYRVLPDERAAKDEFVRVIDESGEDYLYSADRFVPVRLPRQVEQSVARQSKAMAPSGSGAAPSARSPATPHRSASGRKQQTPIRRR